MRHALRSKEIHQQPAGRILDTLIQEYVLGDYSTRWSKQDEREVRSNWFEIHPEMIVNEGFCTADTVPQFSTDISAAISLSKADTLILKTLTTATESESLYWATFSNVPFSERGERGDVWAQGNTQALAICRAALLAV